MPSFPPPPRTTRKLPSPNALHRGGRTAVAAAPKAPYKVLVAFPFKHATQAIGTIIKMTALEAKYHLLAKRIAPVLASAVAPAAAPAPAPLATPAPVVPALDAEPTDGDHEADHHSDI